MSSWRERCRHVIHDVDKALPADATLKDATKALRKAAGEFYCPGTSWPSQVWQDERKKYLARRFGHSHPRKPTKLDLLAGQGEITFPFREEGNQ